MDTFPLSTAGAIYTYFRTLSQENSLKKRGKKEVRKITCRRRERLHRVSREAYCNIVPYYIIAIQKLHERLATLTKASGPDIEKEKWKKVLLPDVISSEESDIEDEGVIIIKLLVWCSQRVSGMFRDLDDAGQQQKSGQARRQQRTRVIGTCPSTRAMPDGLPKWAVA